jgi:competence protein ComEA
MIKPTSVNDSNRPGRVIVLMAALLVTSVATATVVGADRAAKSGQAAPKPQAGASQDAAIHDEAELAKVGEETTKKTCDTACHDLEKLDEQRRTAREWNEVIADMRARGAAGTDQELAIVKQYVKRYYGVVPVNTAPAEEFSVVLGLSAKDAQAIVDYRASHGKFADAAALLKVPGVDKAKIEEQPEALRFN